MSTFHLVVHIRDTFDAVTEFPFPPLTIYPDSLAISTFVKAVQKTTANFDNDTISTLLHHGNQNTVGQLVTSICHLFDQTNRYITELAARSIDSSRNFDEMIDFSL